MIPDNPSIYRIVHRDNLEFILKNGLFASTHPDRDPDYIFIGDRKLTSQRSSYSIPIAGHGNIGEYIAFYFFPQSPMLLNIQTGYRGVEKRSPEEIIYLGVKLQDIFQSSCQWIFTDGHAKNKLSTFYNDSNDLDKIDWSLRTSSNWKNTEEDRDRQRRKQAEFLVRDFIPPSFISNMAVCNNAAYEYVSQVLGKVSLNIDIHIDTKKQFYFDL